MVNGLVTATELGLIGLVGILALRMYSLTRGEEAFHPALVAVEAGTTAGPIAAGGVPGQPARRGSRNGSTEIKPRHRAELRTQLHILAGLQERDCRENGLVLAEAPDGVKIYSAAWLYGAGCALSTKPVRHSEALAGIVTRIIQQKTGLRQPAAVQAISTLTSSNALLACYRAGLDGAEHWQSHHYVPAHCSLFGAATSNAFI